MAGGAGPKKPTFGDINITPLTDVFLVLLVVIIIAAPSTQSLQKDIAAPKITQGVPINKDWLMVEVNKAGKIFIDSAEIPEAELMDKLKAMLPGALEKEPAKETGGHIVVRGDADSASDKILKVLEAAKEAGFINTYIAGERDNVPATVE